MSAASGGWSELDHSPRAAGQDLDCLVEHRVAAGRVVGWNVDLHVRRQGHAVDTGLGGCEPLAHRQALSAGAGEWLPLLDGALAVSLVAHQLSAVVTLQR